MSRSCIVLLSGGLDSLLALRLMVLQGLRVTALHSVNCFHGSQAIETKKARLRKIAAELGAADIVFPDLTDDVIRLTRHPRHGYGKYLNACIDCRMRTVAAGFEHMRAVGADFVVTGEVVGQRPMSQRRNAIELADRAVAEWGHAGRLLRPLSARILPKTVPELEGWVNDACLFDFGGRGRNRQMALAEEIGVMDYPTPAGGCLLTDPEFSRRFAVLWTFTPGWASHEIELLKVGRHFQISPGSRVVASRNEEENRLLEALARPNDRLYLNTERNGALVLLRGQKPPKAEAFAAGLAVYYSKMRDDGSALVASWRMEAGEEKDREEERCPVADPDAGRAMEAAIAGRDCIHVLRRKKRDIAGPAPRRQSAG